MTEDLRRQIPTLSLSDLSHLLHRSFDPCPHELAFPVCFRPDLDLLPCVTVDCFFGNFFFSSRKKRSLFVVLNLPPASFFVNKLRLRQHRRIGDVAVQRPHGDVQRPADRFAYRYQQPSLPSRTICSFNSGRRVTTPAIFRCHCRPVDDIFDQQLEPFRLFGHPIPLCPAPRRQ